MMFLKVVTDAAVKFISSQHTNQHPANCVTGIKETKVIGK